MKKLWQCVLFALPIALTDALQVGMKVVIVEVTTSGESSPRSKA
jgi:hypothetical protein